VEEGEAMRTPNGIVPKALLLLLALLALAPVAAAEDRDPVRRGKPLFAASEVFADALFAPPSEPVDAGRVFRVSEPMQAYLKDNVATGTRLKGPRQALFDQLYRADQLKLDYDTAHTRDAAEAFDARSGNCLSLVILTAAMAKQLGIPVQYQSVFVEETWSRSQGLTFYDGHVNISLRPTKSSGRISNLGASESGIMTIDFVSPEFLDGRRARIIGEQTIVAMFLNNRSAEALAAGRLDDAYWNAREAIVQEPRFTGAYNTLAVVYRRKGEIARAERLLARLLEDEPNNVVTLTNMVLVKRDLGKASEADRLAALLKELQPFPPFYFFDQGVLAMKRGEFLAARDLFTREVRRAGHYHEFHFWLGMAYLNLGEPRQAQRQFNLALENATTESAAQLYQGKLANLQKMRRQYREGTRGVTGGGD
jgi:tetratricopeptide (TPR) repeat protein